MTIQGQTAYSYFGLSTFANLTAVVETVLDNGAMPVTLGGDHSITFPIIQPTRGAGR
jgi:arginase family enzyme